jgi:hypothetical protein
MKDEFYVMRAPEQRDGLIDMIDWINTIRPTSEMRMIEIGSYVGESTLMFADRFKEVVSVDPYINDYDLADDACHHAPFDKVYEQFIRNTLSVPNMRNIKKCVFYFKRPTMGYCLHRWTSYIGRCLV